MKRNGRKSSELRLDKEPGNNLKVLVMTTSFPLFEGIAAGIHVVEKCRHLVKNDVDVTVVAPHHKGAKRKENIDGVKVRRFRYFLPESWQKLAYGSGIPTNLKRSWAARLQLPFFLLSFLFSSWKPARKSDVIHCHWSIAGLAGVILGKLTGKKVVLMMHGAEVFVLGKNPVLGFVVKNADYLICNSSFTQEQTLKYFPVRKSKVISPGTDTSRFYPRHDVDRLREKIKLKKDDIFLLSIGKFIPRKGFEYLIEAINIIVHEKDRKNIQLRIGGRGVLKTKYEKMIRSYRLNDYISFLGYIPDEEIPAYYTEADIFVLPSIIDERGDTEGLGVVFIEAGACETPVIGSKVGGITDVIEDGKNGLFTEEKNPRDLAEKILYLAENNSIREEMGKRGRGIAETRFSWNRIASQIIEVYSELLN